MVAHTGRAAGHRLGATPLESDLTTRIKTHQKAHVLWSNDPKPGRLSEGRDQEEEGNLPTIDGPVVPSFAITRPWFQNPNLGHASGTRVWYIHLEGRWEQWSWGVRDVADCARTGKGGRGSVPACVTHRHPPSLTASPGPSTVLLQGPANSAK